MEVRAKPPVWFRVAGVVLLLWGLIGVGGFVLDPALHPATLDGMDAYDRQTYLARPAWTIAVYGLATVTGLLGTVALLARRRIAHPLYVVSLIAVVLMFGWMLGTTDLIAHKGFATAAGFPIVIALIAAFEIWLAALARRRGWIV